MVEHSPAVKLRLFHDSERGRLRELDIADGQHPSRVLLWSLYTFADYYYPNQYQIDFGKYHAMQWGKLAQPIEGNWNMAKKPGTKNKSAVATTLMEALNFLAIVPPKDDAPYQSHIVLHGGFAIANNGQLSAGYPIAEDLSCCPHFERFKSAISKCGNSLAMTQLDSGKLSVIGDKLRAVVECLELNDYPYTSPDANIAKIDDRLKVAFAVCGNAVSETGSRMVECSLMLQANDCTATDGKVLLQYWHGIDLPPLLVLPKIFASSVGKVKSPLVGFGFTQGRSVTFYFENGAWLKTLQYEDKYPEIIASLLDKPSVPVPITKEFFDAAMTVGEHNSSGVVILQKDKLCSHYTDDIGAQYELKGIEPGLCFNTEYLKVIAPVTTQMDMTSYSDRAFIFGENMRGVIMAVKLNKEPPSEAVREPEQAYRDEPANNKPPTCTNNHEAVKLPGIYAGKYQNEPFWQWPNCTDECIPF